MRNLYGGGGYSLEVPVISRPLKNETCNRQIEQSPTQFLKDFAKSDFPGSLIKASTNFMSMNKKCSQGYCMEGDVDRAFQVLADMDGDDKLAPDEIMYTYWILCAFHLLVFEKWLE